MMSDVAYSAEFRSLTPGHMVGSTTAAPSRRADRRALWNLPSIVGGVTLSAVFAWAMWHFGVLVVQVAARMEADLATMWRGGLF